MLGSDLRYLFHPFLLLLLHLSIAPSSAVVPATSLLQGTLLDPEGNPAEGEFDYQLTFFDQTAGGVLLQSSSGSVTVTEEGIFQIVYTPGVSLLFADQVWYELAIDTENNGIGGEDLFPGRTQLHSVPFTLRALFADNAAFLNERPATDYVLQEELTNVSSMAWSLGGNPLAATAGAFLGTTVESSVEIRVNNERALLIQPTLDGPNLIAGASVNSVTQGVVGGTISGGGTSTLPNRALDNFATVGGGASNSAEEDSSTIAGGFTNQAGGSSSTIGGGAFNRALGNTSVVSGGVRNMADSEASTVSGGEDNTSKGFASLVAGGDMNEASGSFSSVGGGTQNSVDGEGSTLSGGSDNTIESSLLSVIAGGENNTVRANHSAIGGGRLNEGNGTSSTVAGGTRNEAGGPASAVGGGSDNLASGANSIVAGGDSNEARAALSIVAGGSGNIADGTGAAVAGGVENEAMGVDSFVGGGFQNISSGDAATIAGGQSNQASGDRSTIAGGSDHETEGTESAIGGGAFNIASASRTTIGGGGENESTAVGATIGGGELNEAGGEYAVVSGGRSNASTGYGAAIGGGGGFDPFYASEVPNIASGDWSTIGGGERNMATGTDATVGGGDGNTATALNTTISGGSNNIASDQGATVAGGVSNMAIGQFAIASGGTGNTSSGTGSWVGGGQANFASGGVAAIAGGQLNTATGNFSFAAGRRAKAIHHGSFVWADSQDADFNSSATNELAIRAENGLRLAEPRGPSVGVSFGTRFADNSITAWASVNSVGSASASFNVESVTRESIGVYAIKLFSNAVDVDSLIPIANAEVNAPPTSAADARLVSIHREDDQTFRVYVNTGGFSLVDNDFTFVVTGRGQ